MRRPLLLILAWIVGATAARAADLPPFYESLEPGARVEAGVAHLSLAQIQILDELVARAQAFAPAAWEIAASPAALPPFVESLAPDKRYSAGLDALTPAQVARLDELVRARLEPTPAPAAALTTKPVSPRLADISTKPQIHGTVGFGIAAGSHGYSAYGGFMTVDISDPNGAYDLSFSYSESHSRGGYPLWPSYSPGIGYDPAALFPFSDPAWPPPPTPLPFGQRPPQ